MSAGALFLHVVRSDIPEDEAVETLLEWVEVVQQEAPGAVMGVVWTHIDCALPMEVVAGELANRRIVKARRSCSRPLNSGGNKTSAPAPDVLSKTRVLGRVHEEITEQMRALDDAMREMEDVIADHLQDRGAEQGGRLCEKWMRAREQRDAALKALDQRAMVGCTAEDEVVGGAGAAAGVSNTELIKASNVNGGADAGAHRGIEVGRPHVLRMNAKRILPIPFALGPGGANKLDQRLDVADARHIVQLHRLVGNERRRHDRQGGVLVARRANGALQALTAFDDVLDR
jgi:hypothetical protein